MKATSGFEIKTTNEDKHEMTKNHIFYSFIAMILVSSCAGENEDLKSEYQVEESTEAILIEDTEFEDGYASSHLDAYNEITSELFDLDGQLIAKTTRDASTGEGVIDVIGVTTMSVSLEDADEYGVHQTIYSIAKSIINVNQQAPFYDDDGEVMDLTLKERCPTKVYRGVRTCSKCQGFVPMRRHIFYRQSIGYRTICYL